MKIVSATPVGGDFHLDWQAVAGKRYAIDYKTDLMDSDWIELQAGILATGVSEGVIIEMGDAESPAGFFRVRVE